MFLSFSNNPDLKTPGHCWSAPANTETSLFTDRANPLYIQAVIF